MFNITPRITRPLRPYSLLMQDLSSQVRSSRTATTTTTTTPTPTSATTSLRLDRIHFFLYRNHLLVFGTLYAVNGILSRNHKRADLAQRATSVCTYNLEESVIPQEAAYSKLHF